MDAPKKIEVGQTWEINNGHRESKNEHLKYTAKHFYDNEVIVYLIIRKLPKELNFNDRQYWQVSRYYPDGQIYSEEFVKMDEKNLLGLDYKKMFG